MIDSTLQKQLRDKFNPEGSRLRNLQLRIVEILEYIDSICKKNGIKYCASSGTCLGAARHGGFIPWDDDGDVEMTQNEYRRFRKAVIADNNPRFRFYDHSDDPEYVVRFGKVIDLKPIDVGNPKLDAVSQYVSHKGAYVDILILAPSNSKFLHYIGGRLHRIFLLRLNYIRTAWLRRGLKRINFFLFDRLVYPLMQCIQRPWAGDTMRHITGVEFTPVRSRMMLENTIRIPFESIKISVPENYEAYLTNLYGDYNRIPDIEELTPHMAGINDTSGDKQAD
ncbi:MAG: LicD family protein [Paramuribaculum sp.]|nr:LicD family protein [Paramuribaculum sp.]